MGLDKEGGVAPLQGADTLGLRGDDGHIPYGQGDDIGDGLTVQIGEDAAVLIAGHIRRNLLYGQLGLGGLGNVHPGSIGIGALLPLILLGLLSLHGEGGVLLFLHRRILGLGADDGEHQVNGQGGRSAGHLAIGVIGDAAVLIAVHGDGGGDADFILGGLGYILPGGATVHGDLPLIGFAVLGLDGEAGLL